MSALGKCLRCPDCGSLYSWSPKPTHCYVCSEFNNWVLLVEVPHAQTVPAVPDVTLPAPAGDEPASAQERPRPEAAAGSRLAAAARLLSHAITVAGLLTIASGCSVAEACDGATCTQRSCVIELRPITFPAPAPGVWLNAVPIDGECGGVPEWLVLGPEGGEWLVYKRPMDATCGPSCAEADRKGNYLHIPDGVPGTYRIEVKSDRGGGWAGTCHEIAASGAE